MQVGDLVRHFRHPDGLVGQRLEIGIVTHVDTMAKGGYVIAVFPTYGEQAVYPNKVEVINAGR